MRDNVLALRKHERLNVVIPTICRSRTGFRDDVMMYDISIGGCMIESHALTVNVGDLVLIRPEGLEGLAGRVQWADGHVAGVRFEQPLYGPVVDHLHRKYAIFLEPEEPHAEPIRRLAA